MSQQIHLLSKKHYGHFTNIDQPKMSDSFNISINGKNDSLANAFTLIS